MCYQIIRNKTRLEFQAVEFLEIFLKNELVSVTM